jgi:hypothetical protein
VLQLKTGEVMHELHQRVQSPRSGHHAPQVEQECTDTPPQSLQVMLKSLTSTVGFWLDLVCIFSQGLLGGFALINLYMCEPCVCELDRGMA